MQESMRSGLDLFLFILLLAFLVWVPMPFGSASDGSQLPLIIPPLLICAVAALLRATRETPFKFTRPGRIWTVGAILFAGLIGLQLIPMPLPVLPILSPHSAPLSDPAPPPPPLTTHPPSPLPPIT